MEKCRFFSSSTGCSRGDSCRYLHEGAGKRNENKQPCRFFHSPSGCKNGTSCSFLHTTEPLVPKFDAIQLQPSVPYEFVGTRHLNGPFYAIDVECVATGTGHLDRGVARIAVVDAKEDVVFDSYVKPDSPVVSCLTQLTGIEFDHIENARDLKSVVKELVTILPKDSILIGQSVGKDIEWVGLEKSTHYADSFDVAQLFRMFNGLNAKRQYRYFSLRQIVKYVMGEDIQTDDHDPVIDAIYAMRVFHRYRYLHESPGHLQAVHQSLSKTPRIPSFAERTPYIDGVALAANSAAFAKANTKI